jgi:HAD superfamily hydrolase (TIGR01509 family)
MPALALSGLDSLFDVVVTFDDVGVAKPAPDILEAARRPGKPAKACLVFEDRRQGIAAAQEAGMVCIDVSGLERVYTNLSSLRERMI